LLLISTHYISAAASYSGIRLTDSLLPLTSTDATVASNGTGNGQTDDIDGTTLGGGGGNGTLIGNGYSDENGTNNNDVALAAILIVQCDQRQVAGVVATSTDGNQYTPTYPNLNPVTTP